MVSVLDSNAFLSQHTQQALAVAASLAGRQKGGKVRDQWNREGNSKGGKGHRTMVQT
jgi:hypothetical protein